MKNGDLSLFPLYKIDKFLDGYFMSNDGGVYSTKQGLAARKMCGSHPIGSNNRYYTLNNRSYNGRVLFGLAQRHVDFIAETARSKADLVTITVAGKPLPKLTARNHAGTVADGIARKGVVIAQVAMHDGVEHLLFGSKPAIHTTEASYRDEMKRLAGSKPGTKFVALRIEVSVVSGGLMWE